MGTGNLKEKINDVKEKLTAPADFQLQKIEIMKQLAVATKEEIRLLKSIDKKLSLLIDKKCCKAL